MAETAYTKDDVKQRVSVLLERYNGDYPRAIRYASGMAARHKSEKWREIAEALRDFLHDAYLDCVKDAIDERAGMSSEEQVEVLKEIIAYIESVSLLDAQRPQ